MKIIEDLHKEASDLGVLLNALRLETWDWQERAIDLEALALSQRLSVVFSVFEALPVLAALLFRTGLTCLSSRAPLVVSFALAVGLDVLRQRLPAIERHLGRWQVRAVMDGEAGETPGLRDLKSKEERDMCYRCSK